MWLSWIDNYMCWGPKSVVQTENEEFMSQFDCNDVGDVKEYFGCKIDRDEENSSMKFTQPVTIQSFGGTYDILKKNPSTPSEAGNVLEQCSDGAC